MKKSVFKLDFWKSFWDSRKPVPRPVIYTYSCSVDSCTARTMQKENVNPRLRWIDTRLQDPDTLEMKRVTLCPQHAREILNLDEDFYVRTERAEAFVCLEKQ